MEESLIDQVDLPLAEQFGQKWDKAINNLARVLDVPVAIIFKRESDNIRVISTNDSDENPFRVNDTIPIEGSFCRYVFDRDDKFLVPDYRDIDLDINNIATQNDFISYLGFPLYWPNGETFGTICLIDDQRNYYSEATSDFLEQFKNLLNDSLALIDINYRLQRENSRLEQRIEDQRYINGTVLFCPRCNRVLVNDSWKQLETIQTHSEELASEHSVDLCGHHHLKQ